MTNKPNATRTKFLKRAGIRRRPSKLYGYEDTYIQSLTPLQRKELNEFDPTEWGWTQKEAEAMTPERLEQLREETVLPRVCVNCCVDKSGKPLFTVEDVRGVLATEIDGMIVDALADEAMTFNGLGGESLDSLLGKPDPASGTTQTA